MANPLFPKVAFTHPGFPQVEPKGACWWYRTELPRRYLEVNDWPLVGSMDLAKIVHVARSCSKSYIEVVRRLKADGKKVVYETDDNYWASVMLGIKETPDYLDTINKTIALCDAVIVTTQPLADVVKEVTGKEAYVAPNFLCTRSWGNPVKLIDLGKKPILLASGSNSHLKDFQILADIAHVPGMQRFQFVVWGNESFKNIIPGSIWLKPVDLRGYFGTLQSLGMLSNVMGVIPLEDTLFNKSKSKLKWMEYTHAGIPGIYSNLAEYPGHANCTVQGGTKAKQWAERIVDAYESRYEILSRDKQRLGEIGYMDTGIKYWENAFLKIANQK
jgi:hypothetical protein